MPRKQRNKNKKNQQKQLEEDSKFQNSKWAKIVNRQQSSQQQEQANAEQLYTKKKQIFTYDFSNEKVLYQDKPEKPQLKPQDIYTPQQLQQMRIATQKRKSQKQAKQAIKKQKRQERKKQKDVQKQAQRVVKEQQEKQEQQIQNQIKKKAGKSDSKLIPLILIGFLLLMFVMQYQRQIYAKFQHFRINSQEDLYALLETDSGATDKQLKSKYKKLVMKYHPDKNPDCTQCQQKFDKIMKAWEILGNQQKRKHYDENSGFVSEIKSKSLTLTPVTYNTIVQPSKQLWIIQVYDSTSEFCHRFSSLWQKALQDNGNFARFARVDVWHQSNMIKYLHYKFQIFPGVYLLKRGYSSICHLDFNSPHQSIAKCIQQQALTPQFTEIKTKEDISLQNNKIGVILGENMKFGPKFNLILDKFPDKFTIFKNQTGLKNSVTLIQNSNNQASTITPLKRFIFKTKSKSEYKQFQDFLRSSFVQQKTFCQINNQCQQNRCVIILNDSISPKIGKQQNYRMIKPVSAELEQFKIEIETIKNRTEMFQNFDIGIYQSGQIDLGYWDQISQLNSQQGQIINLHCEWKSWADILIQGVFKIKDMVISSK